MRDPKAMACSNDHRISGALERVRRVARHLPVGPREDGAPGDTQPPGEPEASRERDARVIVRPT